ncbi:NADH dehydrogenase [ubiquinone] 1 beta subcomplex subunit 11, mitochondrial [Bufo gargarizans]|uniref:NADH dehydrogenase [ubiquinone] 1 beta subcomplex subunit 11, mitochondrial n=1 Tax=Bufo gargarizans TaxID=30331 RepID=UPI001CF22FCB|nr:NADH dehydrogenase [ubiquinone] 1 beta subcomplex subunit 11, mitochondrial [Bufo gargarizans]
MAMPLCLRALRLSGATRLLRTAPVYRLHTGPRAESTTPVSVSHSAPPNHQHDDHDEINVYDKNPDWHGFSDDPAQDLRNMRLVFFFGVSVCLVMGTVYIYYSPERGMRDWARKEAERQIKRKEAQGLPLIEVNYYDPESLVLPPEDK